MNKMKRNLSAVVCTIPVTREAEAGELPAWAT
jgi:hypothetical protein